MTTLKTTTRKALLVAAALALSVPAFADDAMSDAAREAAMKNASENQTAFSQAVKSIKSWFGSDTPDAVEPAAGDTSTAGMDDDLQVPPAADVENIEPAAGMDEDTIQVPPPYLGNRSDATPRATSFDSNTSVAAFGDGQPSASDLANIESAAGDSAPDSSKMDCAAILRAADEAKEGELPDTALIEACESAKETPVDASMPEGDNAEPAQPGFEGTPAPLPTTQPAAGEPPIGGATMPGGSADEQPSQPAE